MTSVLAAPTPVREWNPELLQQAERELARHIGPVAKVFVSKAAKKAASAAQLIEMLSGEIPGAKDREEYISRLRRAIG